MAQEKEIIRRIYERLSEELPEWDIKIQDGAIIARFNSKNVKYNTDMYIRVDNNGIRIEVFMPDKNGNYVIMRDKAIPASRAIISIYHDNVDRLVEIAASAALMLAYM